MIIQLLNNQTVIYTYDTETKKIDIKSEQLGKQLAAGVQIPEANRAAFAGRKIIKLEDDAELFHNAFNDFIFPKLNQEVFHWELI